MGGGRGLWEKTRGLRGVRRNQVENTRTRQCFGKEQYKVCQQPFIVYCQRGTLEGVC